jgi:hypothetical protein
LRIIITASINGWRPPNDPVPVSFFDGRHCPVFRAACGVYPVPTEFLYDMLVFNAVFLVT